MARTSSSDKRRMVCPTTLDVLDVGEGTLVVLRCCCRRGEGTTVGGVERGLFCIGNERDMMGEERKGEERRGEERDSYRIDDDAVKVSVVGLGFVSSRLVSSSFRCWFRSVEKVQPKM